MTLTLQLNAIPNFDIIYKKAERGGILTQFLTLQSLSKTGDQYVLSVDTAEADLVGESGAKSDSGATSTTFVVTPHKFVHQKRVSDEFFKALEREVDMNDPVAVANAIADSPYHRGVLEDFYASVQKKMTRALDIAMIHGVNPKTNTASTLIGTENFDSKVTNIVEVTAGQEYEDLLDTIGEAETNTEATGIVADISLKTAFRKINGDLSNPRSIEYGTIEGIPTAYSNTVSFETDDVALVGDFAGSAVAGYDQAALNTISILQYGDPDNKGRDLAGHNEIILRAETFLGWNIFAPENFAFLRLAEEE